MEVLGVLKNANMFVVTKKVRSSGDESLAGESSSDESDDDDDLDDEDETIEEEDEDVNIKPNFSFS